MPFNSKEIFACFCILIGFTLILFGDRVFISWAGLELSFYAILPLFANITWKYIIEFFLIQSLGSLVFILGVLSTVRWGSNLIILGLCFKTGLGWFFFWQPKMARSLEWIALFIFLTLFKFPSLIILDEVVPQSRALVFSLIASGILAGTILGLIQAKLRLLMLFSSLNFTSWIIAFILYTTGGWFPLFWIYATLLWCLLSYFLFTETEQVESYIGLSTSEKVFFLLTLTSLAGFPPLWGFFWKVDFFGILVYSSRYFLSYFMAISRIILLAFYLYIIVCTLADEIWYNRSPRLKNSVIFVVTVFALALTSWLVYY